MKYHQIEAFYQVMLTGSISKAAKHLGRTQPAVSQTISSLEDQLGTPLFDRHAGRIVARSEAEVLFQQVSPVMQQLSDIRHNFGRLGSINVPRISIMSTSNAGMHLVPSAIASIAQAGQEVRLMTGSAATIVAEMENQRHDVAIADEGTANIVMNSLLFDAETFQVPTYAIYQRGLIASAGNSLATQDLVGHQVCMLYEENLASRHIRETLSTPRVEFASYFPMACFAATTGSVAVADFITWTALQALVVGKLDIEAKPISDAAPSLYYLLRPRFRPRSKMADACYKALRAELLRHTRAH